MVLGAWGTQNDSTIHNLEIETSYMSLGPTHHIIIIVYISIHIYHTRIVRLDHDEW